MKNGKKEFLDIYVVSLLVIIFVLLFLIMIFRFISVFFLFPIIIFSLYLIKYVRTRDKYDAWTSIKKYVLGLIIMFVVFSFASRTAFKTFEFLASAYGYIETVVLQVSDYEKIDFAKSNIKSLKHRIRYNAHRNLYIVKKCDEKQLLSYIDEIIIFSDKPLQIGNNEYNATSVKYGKVWIQIYTKENYILVAIHNLD